MTHVGEKTAFGLVRGFGGMLGLFEFGGPEADHLFQVLTIFVKLTGGFQLFRDILHRSQTGDGVALCIEFDLRTLLDPANPPAGYDAVGNHEGLSSARRAKSIANDLDVFGVTTAEKTLERSVLFGRHREDPAGLVRTGEAVAGKVIEPMPRLGYRLRAFQEILAVLQSPRRLDAVMIQEGHADLIGDFAAERDLGCVPDMCLAGIGEAEIPLVVPLEYNRSLQKGANIERFEIDASHVRKAFVFLNLIRTDVALR